MKRMRNHLSCQVIVSHFTKTQIRMCCYGRLLNQFSFISLPFSSSDAHFMHLLCYGLQLNDVTRAIVIGDNENHDEIFLVSFVEF